MRRLNANLALIGRACTMMLCLLAVTAAIAMSKETEKANTLKDYSASYYSGDGLGFNRILVFEPDGTFEYKWTGCMGVYGASKGTAKLVNGVIELPPATKDIKQPSALTPVKWGARLYLVENEKLLEFCNDINQKSEPRKDKHGWSFMRVGDESKDVSKAKAELPKEWGDFLLAKPVKGKVVKLIGNNKAELDLGAQDGLKKGMILTAWGNNTFAQIRVVETSDHTCVAATEYRDDHMTAGETVTSVFSRE